ncbi:MAG: serine/threonine-protein kinase [Pseudomonadota bacterium]
MQFGKYLLLDRIAVGGMAEVYRAKFFGAERFEKILAIKKLLPNIAEDEEFVEMFINEAKLASQLTHSNICQIYDLGKIEGNLFIAMEYVWGKDLLQIVNYFRRLKKTMPAPMAAYISTRICEGIDYAFHKRGSQGMPLKIIHRDVSPQNILISYDGEVKIIDFGIAKATLHHSETQAGLLKGKFSYMSPEQVQGFPIDHRSDIFAIGTCLFEMITGMSLFRGDNDFITLERVRKAEVPKPTSLNPNIPKSLEKILLRALALDPKDRWQRAADFQDALQRFLITTPPIYTAKRLSDWMRLTFAGDIDGEKIKMEQYSKLGPEVLRHSLPPSNPPPRPAQSAPRRPDASKRTLLGIGPPPLGGGKGGAIPVMAASAQPVTIPRPADDGFRKEVTGRGIPPAQVPFEKRPPPIPRPGPKPPPPRMPPGHKPMSLPPPPPPGSMKPTPPLGAHDAVSGSGGPPVLPSTGPMSPPGGPMGYPFQAGTPSPAPSHPPSPHPPVPGMHGYGDMSDAFLQQSTTDEGMASAGGEEKDHQKIVAIPKGPGGVITTTTLRTDDVEFEEDEEPTRALDEDAAALEDLMGIDTSGLQNTNQPVYSDKPEARRKPATTVQGQPVPGEALPAAAAVQPMMAGIAGQSGSVAFGADGQPIFVPYQQPAGSLNNAMKWVLVAAVSLVLLLIGGVVIYLLISQIKPTEEKETTTMDMAENEGAVLLRIFPSTAQVKVNGKEIPHAKLAEPIIVPAKVPVEVEVWEDGYKREKFPLLVPPQSTITKEIALQELRGRVIVNSVPDKAEVFVAGQLKGETPVTIDEFPINERITITVKKRDFETWSEMVELNEERTERTLVAILLKTGKGGKAIPPLVTVAKQEEEEEEETAPPPTTATPKGKKKKKKSGSTSTTTKDKPVVTSGGKGEGYFIALTKPWAKVLINGRDTGRKTPVVPTHPIKLSPGGYKVTFVLPTGESYNFNIKIKSGEQTKIIKNFEK